jgi:hypothetical protein
MAQLGETLPLGVIATQALPFQARLQHSILCPKECDHILLLTLQPAAMETPLKSMSPRRFKLGHYEHEMRTLCRRFGDVDLSLVRESPCGV